MRLLWSINVYSRSRDAAILARLVRRHYGDSALIHVYSSHHEAPVVPDADLIQRGSNTGHHNGVRDAYNSIVSLPDFDLFDVIVSSHADCLWSDLTAVDEVWRETSEGGYVAAATTGGSPSMGAMRDPDHMGYFADFWMAMPQVLRGFLPHDGQLDGRDWIETFLYRSLSSVGTVYDIPCRSEDRTDTNMFLDVLGNSNWWFSASHNLTWKLDEVLRTNPDYYWAVQDL